MGLTYSKKEKLKKKIIVIFIVIFIILASYIIWNIFYSEKEKHYPTVKELMDDWQDIPYFKFKSYNVGDIVTIKDTVINSSIIYSHEIELNNSGWEFCKVLNKSKIYTSVFFKSCGNWTWLAFTGDRTDEFVAYKSVKFNVTIKKYDFVPHYFEKCSAILIEEIYNRYLLSHVNYMQRRAKDNCSISLNIENNTFNNFLINITNISFIRSDTHYKDQTRNFVDEKSLHFLLYCDGSKIDDLIPQANQIIGKNNIMKFIPNFKSIYYSSAYEYFIETEDVHIGDKVLINKTLLENQIYELKICWRYTYPEAGYEKERVVGNITFSI